MQESKNSSEKYERNQQKICTVSASRVADLKFLRSSLQSLYSVLRNSDSGLQPQNAIRRRIAPTPFGGIALAKSQKTTSREKRKPKSADAKPKSKIPRYMSDGNLVGGLSIPLKVGRKK